MVKRIAGRVWKVTKVILIVLAVAFAIQGNPWVQRAEYRALAQFCGLTPGAPSLVSPGLCVTVAQVFIGGIQIGASGFPVSVLCSVSGTTNGASEVDITPSCTLPTSTASGKLLAEVFCAPSGGPGPSLTAWIKNATQIAVSPSAAPGTNVAFDCLVVGHN